MTDHPCNCSTCSKTFEECNLQENENPLSGVWYVGDMLRSAFKYTGCFSHTNAGEYFNKGVIGELERRILYTNRHGDQRMVPAYEEAIALIKNGVKK